MIKGWFKQFTFQSGYIQISPTVWDKIGNNNLHSNLVIFKSNLRQFGTKSVIIIYIPIWLYSNRKKKVVDFVL